MALNHKLIYAEPLMAGCNVDKSYKCKFIEAEVIFFPLSVCQRGKMGRNDYRPRDVSLGAELTPRLRGSFLVQAIRCRLVLIILFKKICVFRFA